MHHHNQTLKSFPSHPVVTPSLSLTGWRGLTPIICILSCSSYPAGVSSSVSDLPSELRSFPHIWTGYWNEARILDPVTFDTFKVLPNIPGSVNDCKFLSQSPGFDEMIGFSPGRTYLPSRRYVRLLQVHACITNMRINLFIKVQPCFYLSMPPIQILSES